MSNWQYYHDEVCNDAELLREALDKAIDGVVITAPFLGDGPIVYVSKGFVKLTGYNEDDILGKNCRFLQGEKTEKDELLIIRRAIKERLSYRGVLTNYKKDGSEFRNFIRLEPVHSQDKSTLYYVGSQLDLDNLSNKRL